MNGVQYHVTEHFHDHDDFSSRLEGWVKYAIGEIKDLVEEGHREDRRAENTMDRGSSTSSGKDNS